MSYLTTSVTAVLCRGMGPKLSASKQRRPNGERRNGGTQTSWTRQKQEREQRAQSRYASTGNVTRNVSIASQTPRYWNHTSLKCKLKLHT